MPCVRREAGAALAKPWKGALVVGARHGAAGSPARRGGGPVDKGFFNFARYGSIGISMGAHHLDLPVPGLQRRARTWTSGSKAPRSSCCWESCWRLGFRFAPLFSQILALTQEADERKRRGERPARDRENGTTRDLGWAGT